MDAPLIVTNVEFSEVKKGYDPEEVDNYLRGVDQRLAQVHDMLRDAVERAEAAEAKLAEAMRAKASADQAAAEAQARANEAEHKLSEVGAGGDDGTEALKKMLMLAQRTADSAVEEAQASAKNIVADARSKSAEIVAEAENRSERILVEAQKVADELRQERTAAIAEEVDTLQSRKADLLTDIESLEAFLEDHRVRLRSGVEALAALLDGDLRLEDRPVVHPDPASAEPAPAARPASAPTAEATPGPTPVAVGPTEPAERPAAKVSDLQEAPAPAATPSESGAPPLDQPAPAATGEAAPQASAAPAPVASGGEGDPAGPPTQPISAVSPTAGGDTPSQAVPIVAADAPTGDDEAMRRFFDDDLEVSDEKKGGLFRKK